MTLHWVEGAVVGGHGEVDVGVALHVVCQKADVSEGVVFSEACGSEDADLG